jgi:SAM-dependent methyltransferase
MKTPNQTLLKLIQNSMVSKILSYLKPIFEFMARIETRLARAWVSSAHWRLMAIQWAIVPQPEHFDHHIDLYYQWLATGNSFWVERGVFGGLALKGGDVLELACGDGFNARNFYASRSRQVIACDFDPSAIRVARSKNSAPNVRFELADIRLAMPAGQFENIVWDAAIEHFTVDEIAKILRDIKDRLTSDGILSGHTIVARINGSKMLSHHEHEFSSKNELRDFLSPHFKNVTVFETVHPERSNLYFWASDGAVPFSDDWPKAVQHRRRE